jgi:hypothetical protein
MRWSKFELKPDNVFRLIVSLTVRMLLEMATEMSDQLFASRTSSLHPEVA